MTDAPTLSSNLAAHFTKMIEPMYCAPISVAELAVELGTKPASLVAFVSELVGQRATSKLKLDGLSAQVVRDKYAETKKSRADTDKLDRILASLKTWVSQFETEKAKFIKLLDERPTHALSWSSTIMSLSPRADLAKHYIEAIEGRRAEQTEPLDDHPLTDTQIIDVIREAATERVIQFARGSRRSSNPQSNYIEDETGRAWADLLDLLKWGM
jgi:hypothetical protein